MQRSVTNSHTHVSICPEYGITFGRLSRRSRRRIWTRRMTVCAARIGELAENALCETAQNEERSLSLFAQRGAFFIIL